MKRKQESEHIRKYFVTYKELSDSILSTGDMKMEKKNNKKRCGICFDFTNGWEKPNKQGKTKKKTMKAKKTIEKLYGQI